MWRLLVVFLSCSTCLTGDGLPRAHAGLPWVSCFAEPPSGEGKGPRTVHTPLVTSVNGELRAYAVIEARAAGPC
jgi:hypothetical protein